MRFRRWLAGLNPAVWWFNWRMWRLRYCRCGQRAAMYSITLTVSYCPTCYWSGRRAET